MTDANTPLWGLQDEENGSVVGWVLTHNLFVDPQCICVSDSITTTHFRGRTYIPCYGVHTWFDMVGQEGDSDEVNNEFLW